MHDGENNACNYHHGPIKSQCKSFVVSNHIFESKGKLDHAKDAADEDENAGEEEC